MAYTKKQTEYIDSVDGLAHQSAVKIIGELEAEIEYLCNLVEDVRAEKEAENGTT